jgi:hypothetical protein
MGFSFWGKGSDFAALTKNCRFVINLKTDRTMRYFVDVANCALWHSSQDGNVPDVSHKRYPYEMPNAPIYYPLPLHAKTGSWLINDYDGYMFRWDGGLRQTSKGEALLTGDHGSNDSDIDIQDCCRSNIGQEEAEQMRFYRLATGEEIHQRLRGISGFEGTTSYSVERDSFVVKDVSGDVVYQAGEWHIDLSQHEGESKTRADILAEGFEKVRNAIDEIQREANNAQDRQRT